MDRVLYLQVSEAKIEQIRQIIVEVLRESGAKCGLLIDSTGHLLVRKGFTLIREIENLCVLIAANRETTREIGRILGQEDISVIFHQGSGDHIHSSDVGEQAILTLLFDDRADLAQIHKVISRHAGKIASLLDADEEEGENHSEEGIQKLKEEADKKLGAIFDAIIAPETAPGEDAAN